MAHVAGISVLKNPQLSFDVPITIFVSVDENRSWLRDSKHDSAEAISQWLSDGVCLKNRNIW